MLMASAPPVSTLAGLEVTDTISLLLMFHSLLPNLLTCVRDFFVVCLILLIQVTILDSTFYRRKMLIKFLFIGVWRQISQFSTE